MTPEAWNPDILKKLSERFRDRSPREILQWGFDTFGDDIVMATGFGPSGVVLVHLLSTLQPDATVFYLDTDLLYPETYALRDTLTEQLGVTFTRVHSGISLEEQEAEHGAKLWERNPDRCCFMRKVVPLRRFLSDKQAWITGIRRDQAPTRAHVEVLEWDGAHGLVKLNPLAYWTEEDVWSYIHLHDLPYNRLHDEGYPSIGCMPCTNPVAPGEDVRAGRWRGRSKTECGIHVQPQAA